MKDIEIKKPLMKIQYAISWIFFIFVGFLLIWIIALFLYNYGKDTMENKNKKKGVLNMTYQKFIFIYGSVVGDLAISIWILSLIFAFIGGTLSF